MKKIEEILYMEWMDLLESNIPENTMKSARLRKSPSWPFVKDPEDGRKVIIEFESLSKKYKQMVVDAFGDPYQALARRPIREMVQYDEKAEQVYLEYNGGILNPEYVKNYTWSASWLNMINEAMQNRKDIKERLNLTMDQFFTHVIDMIKQAHLPLPGSYRRLVAAKDSALKKYLDNGPEALIDWRFGNKNTAKVKGEVAESILEEMIAHGNQYDDVFIAQQYNSWATSQNRPTIKAATVGYHRRKKAAYITSEREGKATFNDKYLKKVKGYRPTAPLYFVEHDDNVIDLLFIDPTEKGRTFKKYTAIVVTDSYNDYVLGYAYGIGSPTIELIKAAYMNAMYHLRSLTGDWYLPHEIKSDRWGLKALTPFYESIAKYLPTPVGSKGRGYIEQFFGTPHWKRCLKVGANNYTGNNITARNRGVNDELLNANYKERRYIGDEATQQIEGFFHRLRYMPQGEDKPSKHEEWMQAWSALSADKKRIISDEQFLIKFGIEHNHLGEGIKITNKGVQPSINGTKYNYDLSNYRLEDIGKRVSVIYDPHDMSRVLVTDHDKVRLMAYDARLASRSLEDATLNSRTFLNAIFKEKEALQSEVYERSEKRKKVLSDAFIDAEAVLSSGYMEKEVKQAAEQKFINQNNPDKPEEDINPYDYL